VPFDIIGAKQAGYTDTQIAQEMAGKFGFDYQGARQAKYSDQQIIGEMLSKSDAGATDPATASPKSRADFIRETATVPTQIKEGALNMARAAAPFVRPVLEIGGAVGGGIIGAGAASPTVLGAVPAASAGSVLGYATGKSAADLYDRSIGLKPNITATQMLYEPVQNLAEGAAMDAGGVLIGKGVDAVAATPYYRSARQWLSGITPAGHKAALEAKAGQVILDHTGTAPEYADNAAATSGLEQNIPGFRASLGERTADPGLIKLQRGLERQPGPAADLLLQQQSRNRQALTAHLDPRGDRCHRRYYASDRPAISTEGCRYHDEPAGGGTA
jgi:hypothetical protein